MDIANYLSELLDRHGKVSVPGLGHFAQVRVNGYYNDAEGQLYPPAYKIQFDLQLIDDNDDTLVTYIAEKKKISLASSKYFTEKYITGLKQEVALNEVAFADLGWFYMDNDQIAFKPGNKSGSNPAYYGYAPIALKKLNQETETPVTPPLPVTEATPLPIEAPAEQPEEVFTEEEVPATPPLPVTEVTPLPIEAPAHQPEEVYTEDEAPVTPTLPVTDSAPLPIETPADEPDEVYTEDEAPEKRGISGWLIALIIIAVIAAAAFAVYKYNPGLFNFNKQQKQTDTVQTQPQPITKADTDTVKTTEPVTDTTSKTISKPAAALKTVATVAAAPDTVAKPAYVIFAGAFRTEAKGDEAVQNLKSIGVDARLLNGPGTGRLIKVIIGNFATSAEGEAARIKLVNSGKIRKDSYTQIINQKQ